jgi:hypothetical protein
VIAHDKPPWTLDWVSTGLIGRAAGLFPGSQINRSVDLMRSSDLERHRLAQYLLTGAQIDLSALAGHSADGTNP